MKIDPPCPVIETKEQARMIGVALHKVLRFDKEFAERVFSGSTKLGYSVGKNALNDELQSQWDYYTTLEERQRIFAEYVAARLD